MIKGGFNGRIGILVPSWCCRRCCNRRIHSTARDQTWHRIFRITITINVIAVITGGEKVVPEFPRDTEVFVSFSKDGERDGQQKKEGKGVRGMGGQMLPRAGKYVAIVVREPCA